MPEKADGELTRHPIFISDNTVVLVSVFKAFNRIADLWMMDYTDHRLSQITAAKQMMAQIGDLASINFLWALREAIAEEINAHNKACGTSFPIDRPPDPPND